MSNANYWRTEEEPYSVNKVSPDFEIYEPSDWDIEYELRKLELLKTGEYYEPNTYNFIYLSEYHEGFKKINKKLLLDENITIISKHAFEGSLFHGELIIPRKCYRIDNYAFNDCKNFTGILEIPNNVRTIGNMAFDDCFGFEGLRFENNSSLRVIKFSAFGGCKGIKGHLEIPNSVQVICSSAFSGCSGITSLKIGSSVRFINSIAFSGCTGIRGDIVIPKSVEEIGIDAFKGCVNVDRFFVPKRFKGWWLTQSIQEMEKVIYY